mmetsp:Transcript_19664/g.25483  ORF Transcript_19664/g.25483 Transcript_19664/m.25483 type:complete len:172 (-) Transcript_19664:77-592(-)
MPCIMNALKICDPNQPTLSADIASKRASDYFKNESNATSMLNCQETSKVGCLSPVTNKCIVAKPLRCPPPPRLMIQDENEEKLLERVYSQSTWEMYYLITRSRAARTRLASVDKSSPLKDSPNQNFTKESSSNNYDIDDLSAATPPLIPLTTDCGEDYEDFDAIFFLEDDF